MPRPAQAVSYRRASPLDGIAKQGRFGADKGAPGVTLSVRHPLLIVLIMMRKGTSKALAEALKKSFAIELPGPSHTASSKQLTLHWCGANQWYAVAKGQAEGALFLDLSAKLAGVASCSDQSHGRLTLLVAGPRARDVLAKGTPVDLHPRSFGPGRCAVTQMAHVGVHLAQVGDDVFELSLFRGFSESYWEWLTTMAEEFGYRVV
jgi:methylglutamate dehydrogenase subunit D